MDAEALWSLFAQTGAPVFYLLYRQTRKDEEERETMPVSA